MASAAVRPSACASKDGTVTNLLRKPGDSVRGREPGIGDGDQIPSEREGEGREDVPAARMAAAEERWEAEARRDLAAWNSFLEALMVGRRFALVAVVGLRRGGAGGR